MDWEGVTGVDDDDRGRDADSDLEAQALENLFDAGADEEPLELANGSLDARRVELALRDLEDDAYRTGRELDTVDVQRAAARHGLSVAELAAVELRAEAVGLLPLSSDDSLPGRIDWEHLQRPEATAVDSLQRWFDEASRYPLLQQEQEVALARAMEDGAAASHELSMDGLDATVRSKLEALVERGVRAKAIFIESNLRLVASIAKNHRGQGVEFLDLLQEGVLGLVRAVEKFDWRLGYKFSTYATWWIRQSVQRAVDNQAGLIRIPVHIRERMRQLKRQRRKLEVELAREPTLAELATETALDPAEIAFLQDLEADVISLDRPVGDDPDGLRLADLLDDGRPNEFELALDQRADQELVAQFLDLLTAREREVLIRRFGLDDGEPDTLEEIGASWGLTRERIRQIENKALKRLTDSGLAARERANR
jgi:RNA polymerase nonessential primary-like sigma factor